MLRKTYYASDSTVSQLGIEYIYNEDRRVYYYRDQQFNLLYDFNAEKGDTLTFREPYFTNTTPDSTFSMVVDRTEIISYRPWLDLKAIYSHTITGPWDMYNLHIEKIGNIPYMFPQIDLQCDAQCYNPFRGYLDYQLNYWGDEYGPFNYRELINDIPVAHLNGQIKVYPNPFNESFEIVGLPPAELSLTCYDLMGRPIFKNTIPSNGSHTINTSLLNSGIYILNLINIHAGYCYKNQIIIKN